MKCSAVRANEYRNKAEEVRIIAESAKEPESRAALLAVWQSYLNLAAVLEHMMDNAGEGPPEPPDPKQ